MSCNDTYFLACIKAGDITVTRAGRVRNCVTGNWVKGGGRRYRCLEFRGRGGVLKYIGIHRLIWLALKGPIPKGHTINHKNGKRKDCRPSNLECGPHRDNIKHAQRKRLAHCPARGDYSPLRKLTESQVSKIRTQPGTTRGLAALYGVSQSLIGMIKRGQRRTLRSRKPLSGGIHGDNIRSRC